MPWDFWLIFFFLGVVVPWRGRTRLKKLMEMPAVDTTTKLRVYAATIGFQWVVASLVGWRAVARGISLEELGLSAKIGGGVILTGLVGGVLIGGAQWLNLRRVGSMQGEAHDLLAKLATRLLPVNAVEFLPYSLLAITAGVCEEFLYRGFGMVAISRSGAGVWMAVLVTAVLFGLAHAYQGPGGVISTAILGLLFAIGRLAWHSLVPVMMWHSGLDLAAGLAAHRYFPQRVDVG